MGVVIAALLAAHPGAAEEGYLGFSCRPQDGVAPLTLESEESINLLNGTLYFGAVAGIEFGATPRRRWSRRNGFDTGLRDGLRLDSTSAREDADLASDVTLAIGAAILPAATIGAHLYRTGDCRRSLAMATEAFESVALTLLITEAVKISAGRERPFARSCEDSPPDDASCGRGGRLKSFISGHTSLAAAGAGVSCAHAWRDNAWGDSRWSRGAPCAVGFAAAISTAALRMAADRHWGSDVLLGFAVGATVGWFDTWGPFDLLRFTTRGDDGKVAARGIVLPSRHEGALGARLLVRF